LRLRSDKLKFDKAKSARKLRLNRQRLELDQLKFEQSLRQKLDVALDALAKSFKKYPEAMELYEHARKKLEELTGE